jgi:hypothetical protein
MYIFSCFLFGCKGLQDISEFDGSVTTAIFKKERANLLALNYDSGCIDLVSKRY